MATLKSLVDETTNIKNELKSCHTNLKNNLVNKGVSIASTDKLSTLVDKINNLGIKINKQSGELSLNDTNTNYVVPISKVDLSKSICFGTPNQDTSYNVTNKDLVVSFANNANLSLSRGSARQINLSYYWEVLEFQSGVKNIYNFAPTFPSSDIQSIVYSHNLNLKNPEKCLIYLSVKRSSGGTESYQTCYNLTQNTLTIKGSGLRYCAMNIFIVELM